ncbi:hypothetical protein E2C01_069889 [Portunus trituberculatus]|uniref:Uncharacterized protein n=1 Tax=Portunus trituberculatus TaxID=210409 RepID=A0A5B7I0R3_PORTR|nr:hypothetical protein [Portunus trituberculatus]
MWRYPATRGRRCAGSREPVYKTLQEKGDASPVARVLTETSVSDVIWDEGRGQTPDLHPLSLRRRGPPSPTSGTPNSGVVGGGA